MLAEEILAGRLNLSDWDHAVEQWIIRLNRLIEWCPDFGLPPITRDDRRHRVEQLCHGAFSYKAIKDKPVRPLVHDWLSSNQRALLDQHAPERLELANGKKPKVAYDPANPPHIALQYPKDEWP